MGQALGRENARNLYLFNAIILDFNKDNGTSCVLSKDSYSKASPGLSFKKVTNMASHSEVWAPTWCLTQGYGRHVGARACIRQSR